MKKINIEKNLTENVMEEIYLIEKQNLLKTLTLKVSMLIIGASVFFYLFLKGLQMMSDNGDTALFELIIEDGELMREFFVSELMYLLGIFDTGLFVGIIITLLLMSFLIIMSWKSKTYLINKWNALNRLKSRFN